MTEKKTHKPETIGQLTPTHTVAEPNETQKKHRMGNRELIPAMEQPIPSVECGKRKQKENKSQCKRS